MTRAAIYVRVSTEEQTRGYSIDEQLGICRKLCAERGWTIVNEYQEPGVSGKSFTRPAWQRMIDEIDSGAFDVLVCYSIDRFSRGSLADSFGVLERLKSAGVTFASASEPFDFTGPLGDMLLAMFLAMARGFIVNLSAKVTLGRQGRAKSGRSNANRPPWPYIRNAEGDDVIDDRWRALGQEMFERCAAGHTVMQIAAWLNDNGARTPYGRIFSKYNLTDMLRNPFYTGRVIYKGMTGNDISHRKRRSDAEIKLHSGRHEALVSQELFDRARAALQRKGGKVGRPPKRYNSYLLQGLARCAVCGGRMTCSSPEPGRPRYSCMAHERGLGCANARIGVRDGSVAPQIDAIIERLRVRDGVLEAAREIAESADERSRLTDKRAEINAELKRLDHMFQKGRLAQSDYDRRVDDLQLALSQLRPMDAGDVDSAGPRMASLVDAWKAANTRERNGILKALIRSVTLDALTREVVSVEPLEDFAALFRAANVPIM